MKETPAPASSTRPITRSLPPSSDAEFAWRQPALRTLAPRRLKAPFQALLLGISGTLLLLILLLLIVPGSEQSLADAHLVPGMALLALLLVALLIISQTLLLRDNAQLAEDQHAALSQLAEANARIEQQRGASAAHARELEDTLEQLQETYARVAQGEYAARARETAGGALHPVITTVNLLLERIERSTRMGRQHEQLGQMALTLARISRRLEQGDTTAMRSLTQPSGTPIDDITRLITRLERYAGELEGKLQASQRTIDRLSQFNLGLSKVADALGRLAFNTQEIARKLQEQYMQLARLAEAPTRSIKAAPAGFFSNPLPKIFGPIGSGPLAGRLAASPKDMLPLVQGCVVQAESCWQEARACAVSASQISEGANKLIVEIRRAQPIGE